MRVDGRAEITAAFPPKAQRLPVKNADPVYWLKLQFKVVRKMVQMGFYAKCEGISPTPFASKNK